MSSDGLKRTSFNEALANIVLRQREARLESERSGSAALSRADKHGCSLDLAEIIDVSAALCLSTGGTPSVALKRGDLLPELDSVDWAKQ